MQTRGTQESSKRRMNPGEAGRALMGTLLSYAGQSPGRLFVLRKEIEAVHREPEALQPLWNLLDTMGRIGFISDETYRQIAALLRRSEFRLLDSRLETQYTKEVGQNPERMGNGN